MTDAGAALTRQARRHRLLTDAVMAAGTVTIEELARALDVSVMTVHRDLDQLESQNVLRKSRGVATALPSSTVESNDVYRRNQQRVEKAELSSAAMAFVQPGQTLMLDDSTTLLPLLGQLGAKAPLTVVSNSLSVTDALVDADGIQLVLVGGDYRRWCRAFMGQLAIDAISALRVDVLVMSTSAVTGAACYHQQQDTVSIKRAMLRVASTKVLLVDHSKFQRRAMFRLCALDEFDHVVVDSGTTTNVVDDIRRHGVDVTIARSMLNQTP